MKIFRTKKITREKIEDSIANERGISLTRIHLEFANGTSQEEIDRSKAEAMKVTPLVTHRIIDNKMHRVTIHWRTF